MTDRELLELAAKAAVAAGMNLTQHHGIWYDSDYDIEWSPKREDGDAFRLAVKLGLFQGPHMDHSASQVHSGDECQDYRTAIFLAAVEIGKAK